MSYRFMLFSVQFQFLQKYLSTPTLPSENSCSIETLTVMIYSFTNISSPLLLTTSLFSRSFYWEGGKEGRKLTTFDNLVTSVFYLIVSKNVKIKPGISILNGRLTLFQRSDKSLPIFPSFYINYLCILPLNPNQGSSCGRMRLRYDFSEHLHKFRFLSGCTKLQN